MDRDLAFIGPVDASGALFEAVEIELPIQRFFQHSNAPHLMVDTMTTEMAGRIERLGPNQGTSEGKFRVVLCNTTRTLY
jgi:hypothetical protein